MTSSPSASRGPPELLTVVEAAEYLCCKPQRDHDVISQGRLRCFKHGARVLIRRGELLEYLEGPEA